MFRGLQEFEVHYIIGTNLKLYDCVIMKAFIPNKNMYIVKNANFFNTQWLFESQVLAYFFGSKLIIRIKNKISIFKQTSINIYNYKKKAFPLMFKGE